MEWARLLQVHICADDRYQGRPLYEVVVEKCRELGIAGATVMGGQEGYGSTGAIRRAPVVVTIVDSGERIARLAAALSAMLEKGMVVAEPVRVRRVRHDPSV